MRSTDRHFFAGSLKILAGWKRSNRSRRQKDPTASVRKAIRAAPGDRANGMRRLRGARMAFLLCRKQEGRKAAFSGRKKARKC